MSDYSRGEYIFLVTHLLPYPPARGVELRILHLLRWLHAGGYRVVLIVSTAAMPSEHLDELRKVTHAVYWTTPALRTRLGQQLPWLRKKLWEPLRGTARPLANSDHVAGNGAGPADLATVGDAERKRGLCPDALIALVGNLARKYRPRVVIAEYIFLTPCFRAAPPQALKIVDTIDVFSRKSDQVLAFGIDDAQACTAEEERRYLLTADVVLAIQPREAELLKALAPEREVLLVGMDFDVPASGSVGVGEPDSVALVASDNALNVHGLRAFLADCWPAIKQAHPATTLQVVGKIGEQCRIDDSSITYNPWVDDLTQTYRDARVIINPTIAGTGLKIKSAQALAHGKPLVAWTNGVEGLVYEGEPPYVECRSWPEFGEVVVRLLQSESEALALGKRARAYAEKAFSAAEVYGPLSECLAHGKPRATGVQSTNFV